MVVIFEGNIPGGFFGAFGAVYECDAVCGGSEHGDVVVLVREGVGVFEGNAAEVTHFTKGDILAGA